MNQNIRIRLSIMMFVQFFIWGTWYAKMNSYLSTIGFDGLDIGAAYSTVNWGAILSPFIIGMIADRFFSAEKVLGIIHLAGAGLLWYVASITEPTPFFWTMLVYGVLYMPTLALVNAISFYQMRSPEKEFPAIRVLGTIGWIAAGWMISLLNIETSNNIFKLGALASIILGVYAFFLPNTPPKSKGKKVTLGDILGLEALKLFKDRNFSIFILCSLLISIPLAFYFSFAGLFLDEVGMQNTALKLSFGQMSEILFMMLMPFFFIRLGVKKMLLIGMAAWILRYILFAYGNMDDLVVMFYIGIIVHGICYDFFFVTGQIYVDNAAPKEIQASAQGLIALITYGIGMLIGSWSSGWIVQTYTLADGSHNWNMIWLIPAAMALVAAFLFFILFKEKRLDAKTAGVLLA